MKAGDRVWVMAVVEQVSDSGDVEAVLIFDPKQNTSEIAYTTNSRVKPRKPERRRG